MEETSSLTTSTISTIYAGDEQLRIGSTSKTESVTYVSKYASKQLETVDANLKYILNELLSERPNAISTYKGSR